ncbi:hypothetical protein LSTR_LSTR016558 [Laodelphax striatellus]|uniref:Uncharacterized protein n=1 Tax=Laodelphax striatellus TaxID=195883 RepID=A0A482XIV1_LAOST|nr:hypothetical protein LSTR_LSTR016558 [Laodelphax striatellus]
MDENCADLLKAVPSTPLTRSSTSSVPVLSFYFDYLSCWPQHCSSIFSQLWWPQFFHNRREKRKEEREARKVRMRARYERHLVAAVICRGFIISIDKKCTVCVSIKKYSIVFSPLRTSPVLAMNEIAFPPYQPAVSAIINP